MTDDTREQLRRHEQQRRRELGIENAEVLPHPAALDVDAFLDRIKARVDTPQRREREARRRREEEQRQRAERDAERRRVQARRKREWRAVVPAAFGRVSLDDLDPPVREAASAWAAEPSRNLVIVGALGVGKTHAALAAARAAHAAGRVHDVTFAPVVELLDALRPDGTPQRTIRRATTTGLLILDDLGAERPSDWTAERLYLVVNRRWLDRAPIIATSNLVPDELAEATGARIWSRLCHGAARIQIGGRDRRRP